jgi:hypothetical protein
MSEDATTAGDRAQDPLVERYRPDPAQPAATFRTLQGFWGHSDRAGFRRLYFTRSLNSYAEFRADDIASTADIPADESPYPGEQATRVVLPTSAMVDFVRTRSLARDPFDLDLRFRRRLASAEGIALSPDIICLECATVPDVTCDTSMSCDTCFGDHTCPGGGTCDVSQCICATDDCPTQTCPGEQSCENC